jgi:hypothetical protein
VSVCTTNCTPLQPFVRCGLLLCWEPRRSLAAQPLDPAGMLYERGLCRRLPLVHGSCRPASTAVLPLWCGCCGVASSGCVDVNAVCRGLPCCHCLWRWQPWCCWASCMLYWLTPVPCTQCCAAQLVVQEPVGPRVFPVIQADCCFIKGVVRTSPVAPSCWQGSATATHTRHRFVGHALMLTCRSPSRWCLSCVEHSRQQWCHGCSAQVPQVAAGLSCEHVKR